MPAARPVIVLVVAVLLHKYEGLAALVLTVAVPFGFTQLLFDTLEQVAVGLVVLLTIVTEQLFVQEVTVLVTVTV